MKSDLFIKWAEDSLDAVAWISSELFNKKSANTEMLALCLALAVRHSCPRRESYKLSSTGPRTAIKDESLRVVMAATLIHEFGQDGVKDLDERLIEPTLQDYANGGLKQLESLLEDSDDRVGALVAALEGLMATN